MKIEKIQIDDYKIFKNFNISFLDDTDKPLDLVVLAGINGSGKTSLFEFIQNKLGNKSQDIDGNIAIDATSFNFNGISFGKKNISDLIQLLITKYKGQHLSETIKLFQQKILYIKAQEQKTNDLKKEIIKYIDDIIYEEGLAAKEAYERLSKKLNTIFEGLDLQIQFSGLDGEKNIYFKNSLDEKISIDTLSTGEKEILSKVFFLFISDIKDSIILIDEPEISLHPSWQNRIVKIYKAFAKQNNNQIILATHSPQIIASTPNESLRVLVKENGKIIASSLNAYGMDVNKALVDIMGVKELRDIELQTKYDKVKNMILSNDYTSNTFKTEFNELENMMSNDPIDFGLLKLELLKREKNARS